MTDHGIRITQYELQEMFELKREIEQRQKRLDELTANVKALLFEKIPIEEGRFDARLLFRRVHHPAWRQAVVDNLGMEFAEAFRKAATSNVLCDVVVEEHAVPPLWRGSSGGSEFTS